MDKIIYNTLDGRGYVVKAFRNNILVEDYRAGDCWIDSGVFNTGNIQGEALHKLALYSANLIKEQYGLKCRIQRDANLGV